MRYLLFGCVLTFVEVWIFISCADINFVKYHYDFNLAGHRCIPHKTAFETGNVFDPLQCGKLCHFNKACRSVFYKPDSNKCVGCRVNPDIVTGNIDTWLESQNFRAKPVYSSETDCKDILKDRPSAQSGLYKIRLWKSKKTITVYCDMDTDGGGWTVFQNRFNGSVNFNRIFYEYEDGFGAINGEFWLGLKNIQELSDQDATEIRLEVTKKSGEEYYATYKEFKLLDGTEYKLSVNASTVDRFPVFQFDLSFSQTNGYPFSTYDNDMDSRESGNCAELKQGGWWYDKCTYVSLNGKYCTTHTCTDSEGETSGIYHVGFAGPESLKTSRMLIRRY